MIEDRVDYFIFAYDSPNFSAAAAKVPMSPQGFTKMIHNLERDLGVKLFESDARGVRHPTRYADVFYKYAKNMQDQRRILNNRFTQIEHENATEIRVACAVGIPGFLGIEKITDYHDKNNNVTVKFTELPDTLCDSLVKEGRYDLAITLQPVDPALTTRNLYSAKYMMWVKKDSSLASSLTQRKSLGIDDIAPYTIAMPGKDFRCYHNLVAQFAERNKPIPHIVECSEIFWIYQFVKSGRGIGFTLPHLAALDIFSKDETIVAIPFVSLDWQVCLAWPKTRVLTEPEEKFFDYLDSICKHIKRRY